MPLGTLRHFRDTLRRFVVGSELVLCDMNHFDRIIFCLCDGILL